MSDIEIKLVSAPGELSTDNESLLKSLDEQCFPQDTRYEPSGEYAWIAYRGNEPAGYIVLKLYHGANEGIGFLYRVGVLCKFRGEHLQTRLTRILIRKAKSLGLKRIITYASRYNFPSIVNLLKSGMRLYKPSTEWGLPCSIYFSMEL